MGLGVTTHYSFCHVTSSHCRALQIADWSIMFKKVKEMSVACTPDLSRRKCMNLPRSFLSPLIVFYTFGLYFYLLRQNWPGQWEIVVAFINAKLTLIISEFHIYWWFVSAGRWKRLQRGTAFLWPSTRKRVRRSHSLAHPYSVCAGTCATYHRQTKITVISGNERTQKWLIRKPPPQWISEK